MNPGLVQIDDALQSLRRRRGSEKTSSAEAVLSGGGNSGDIENGLLDSRHEPSGAGQLGAVTHRGRTSRRIGSGFGQ